MFRTFLNNHDFEVTDRSFYPFYVKLYWYAIFTILSFSAMGLILGHTHTMPLVRISSIHNIILPQIWKYKSLNRYMFFNIVRIDIAINCIEFTLKNRYIFKDRTGITIFIFKTKLLIFTFSILVTFCTNFLLATGYCI